MRFQYMVNAYIPNVSPFPSDRPYCWLYRQTLLLLVCFGVKVGGSGG